MLRRQQGRRCTEGLQCSALLPLLSSARQDSVLLQFPYPFLTPNWALRKLQSCHEKGKSQWKKKQTEKMSWLTPGIGYIQVTVVHTTQQLKRSSISTLAPLVLPKQPRVDGSFFPEKLFGNRKHRRQIVPYSQTNDTQVAVAIPISAS